MFYGLNRLTYFKFHIMNLRTKIVIFLFVKTSSFRKKKCDVTRICTF